jgi:bleomycin hydrolase
MNRKTILLSLSIAFAGCVMAQSPDGGISRDMLKHIQGNRSTSTADKAIFNAIASNSIDDLAKNHQNMGEVDTYFSNETKKQSIHDQKSSGRCWMFSGLNVLRSNFALRSDSLTVEFSQDYLFFWDQLEKANLFLQGMIDTADKPIDNERVRFFFRNPINDGGTFCGVADLAEKYGLVPMSVMPETYSADNTRRMAAILSSKLREFGLELRDMATTGKKKAAALKARKTEMLGTIYHILVLNLGEPVKEFSYAFKNKDGKSVTPVKTYTPLEFYKATVGGPINGTFIMAMNDPRHPYYKTYEVEYDRHTYDGHNWKYINLPMEEIEKIAIASIKDGHKMYSSYDVGKQFDRKRGYMDTDIYDYGTLFGTTFPMNKAQRIMTFDSGSTHAMTLTAVDIDANGKPTKWKVENSWGPSFGQSGCLIMTNNWFENYMFRLVANKKYVSDEVLKAEQQKPIMVMPEDPLFQEDM